MRHHIGLPLAINAISFAISRRTARRAQALSFTVVSLTKPVGTSSPHLRARQLRPAGSDAGRALVGASSRSAAVVADLSVTGAGTGRAHHQERSN